MQERHKSCSLSKGKVLIMMAVKAVKKAFEQFLRETWDDIMLAGMLFIPVIAGLLFKFGIPELERFIINYYELSFFLSPYYVLFDSFLSTVTPLMFSFVSAMVILGEHDNGLSVYLAVTPLGKGGYLVSRLGVPVAISVLYGIFITAMFSITSLSLPEIIILSLMSALLSVPVSMLIVSVSSNKVEGMALAKLSSLMLLGLPLPFFMDKNTQFLASFLPSFWMGKFVYSGMSVYILIFVAVSLLWTLVLHVRFIKKIM